MVTHLKRVFKNCTPFRECTTEINNTFFDKAQHVNIAMPMNNLIEYSGNYSDTSRSLWQFKRDEIEDFDLTIDDNHISNNSSSFKYKSYKFYYKRKCCKNSCTTKIFGQFLEIIRNAVD